MATAVIPSRSTLQVRVYLEDTDAGGVVYHGSYLRYMERVRTEWLRNAGIQHSETYEDALSFVVHKLNMSFLRPARLDTTLEISCQVDKATAARIIFTQDVTDLDNGTVYCRAEAHIACIDMKSARPRRLPAHLLAALTPPG